MRVVILHGPEIVLQRERLDEVRKALEGKFGEVETVVLDGRTASLSDVLDEARSYNLMQTHKLVVVDEAAAFLNEDTRPAMERYAEAPVEHATLVLRSPTWRPGRLDKAVDKAGMVVKCEGLSPADLKDWVQRHATADHQAKIEPAAADLLVERLGGNLTLVAAELPKLALLVQPGQTLTAAAIEPLLGRSSDAKAWAVQEAILTTLAEAPRKGARAAATALEALHEVMDLADQPKELVNYFVCDLMRKLEQAVAMRRQGMNEAAIAREFRLWGPAQARFIEVLQRLDSHSAGRLLDRAAALDFAGKSSRGDPLRNLECFCASLADK